MAKKLASDVEALLDRAQSETLPSFQVPLREKRYIFSGDPQSSVAGYAIRPNRKAVRRKRSTFNIILSLFGCGVAIIVYISNIITVNQIALDVNRLQATYDKIVNTNGALRAEINRKSGWERIGKIATERLDLKYPKEQPTWFEVDFDKLEQVQKK